MFKDWQQFANLCSEKDNFASVTTDNVLHVYYVQSQIRVGPV